MNYRHAKLEDSYNYPEWHNSIRAHLMLFRVHDKIEKSKALRHERKVRKAKSSKIDEELAEGTVDLGGDDSTTDYDSDHERSPGLAQSSIFLSLSGDVQTKVIPYFPFRNTASFWDHLYDLYGTPRPRDIRRAYQTLFPRKNWEESENVMANISEQRRAAQVLNAAKIPVAEELVTYSHLQYLPPSFYQSPVLQRLSTLLPGEIANHDVFHAIEMHIKHRPRRKRCYYHNTTSHDITDCRIARQLLKQKEKDKGRHRRTKADEESSINKIFQRIPESDWYCGRHETNDHDDQFCIEQLQERYQSQ